MVDSESTLRDLNKGTVWSLNNWAYLNDTSEDLICYMVSAIHANTVSSSCGEQPAEPYHGGHEIQVQTKILLINSLILINYM